MTASNWTTCTLDSGVVYALHLPCRRAFIVEQEHDCRALTSHPAPLGATAQPEPRWPDMNGPCPHGHCQWDLGSHVATPRYGLRCPGWQDGRVPYRAKTIEGSRLHDSDENAGFLKVCAPLGATDEGLREAVERYQKAWAAWEACDLTTPPDELCCASDEEVQAEEALLTYCRRASLQAGG